MPERERHYSLFAKAQAEAESIVAEAKKQAEAVQAQAAAKAAELDKNTRAELRLFAEQSVNALKTEVTNVFSSTPRSSSLTAMAG